jgi:hypothetical protein
MSPYVAPIVFLWGAMVKGIDHQTGGSAFYELRVYNF